MSRLVIVVPLREGAHEEARTLIDEGPPFKFEGTRFDRHDVYLTQHEAVFVFEAPGVAATLDLAAESPQLWRAAAAWEKLLADRPRTAATAYSWRREDG